MKKQNGQKKKAAPAKDRKGGTTAKTTSFNRPAADVPAALPPPTGKQDGSVKDEWRDSLEAALSLDPGSLEYGKTLDENGFDPLDVVDFCLWVEDRYGIEFLKDDDEVDAVLARTLGDLKAEAEKVAGITPRR